MGASRWITLTFALFVTISSQATQNSKWEFYSDRYNLTDVDQKLTNTVGNGFEPLYGTRNLRQVLRGVVYRGGANNSFHKHHKRPNMNPLPPDGLANLCAEGFQSAVYLYTENYDTAQKLLHCRDIHAQKIKLQYHQHTPTKLQEAHKALRLVHSHLTNPSKGPIYLHCWNGWHASGLISAYTLRQFCGWDAQKAIEYWDRNTDGNNTEPGYESYRRRIREFQPLKDLKISAEIQAKVCPQ